MSIYQVKSNNKFTSNTEYLTVLANSKDQAISILRERFSNTFDIDYDSIEAFSVI